MTSHRRPRLALLFGQFAAYHVDRCEAVAARLGDRFEVLAIEVATRSEIYAWEPSGGVNGARKLTLFPGESWNMVHWLPRLWRQFLALWRCRIVLMGIPYNEPDIVILSWLLRFFGVEVVLLSESKFDDRQRRAGFELFKALLMAPYRAAIVGGPRQIDYVRMLGFRRRPVFPGYDTIGLARIRAMGDGVAAPDGVPFSQRPFVYVGRFVTKKNLSELIDAYALYAAAAPSPRRLVLVGSGELEAALSAQAETCGVRSLIDFNGFLDARGVAQTLAGALALILPSREEQWGLVVNEALAFGLPAIVSGPVGSRDALVRNLINGFVIEPGSLEGFAEAMRALAGDEQLWRRMVAASHQRAWMGDCERLADAAELCIDPFAQEPGERVQAFIAATGWRDDVQ